MSANVRANATERLRVLTFASYYLPGYKSGGPVRSISNLARSLTDEMEFLVVTRDRDADAEAAYGDIRVNDWNRVGEAQVYYAPPQGPSLSAIPRLVEAASPHVLYFNSYFDPGFTIKPLLLLRFGRLPAIPAIIAPRGELSPGALRLKQFRKKAYRRWAKAVGLYRGLVWQASSSQEAGDIRRTMDVPASDVMVAPDLPSIYPSEVSAMAQRERRDEGAPLRLLFLSRITPMKNLDFALRVLARVRTPVEFSIVGPVRDQQYWQRCQALIDRLPNHIKVSVEGGVPHSHVTSLMATFDLLFLPTRGENYGHVIPEALSSGTPVLIADTTPWRNLERAGVGWDLPLSDEAAFAAAIEEAATIAPGEYLSWRRRAADYARQRLADSGVLEANRSLFQKVAASRGMT